MTGIEAAGTVSPSRSFAAAFKAVESTSELPDGVTTIGDQNAHAMGL